MTKQMTKTAMMMVLAIGLIAGATMAQKIDDGGIVPSVFYTGFETADGTLDPMSENLYGNNFVMNNFGKWESRHLTVSVDYPTNPYNSDNFIVTGGTWSLVIIRENQYAGTLYGKVAGGVITLIEDPKEEKSSKLTQLKLQTTGDIGVCKEKENCDITGDLNMTTDLKTKETNGYVSFNF